MKRIDTLGSLVRSRTGWFYALALAVLTLMLFCLSKFVVDNLNFNFNDTTFKVYSLLTALADGVLLLAVYWLLPSRHKGWLWWLLALMTVWGVAQVLYLPSYQDIMPWASFTMVQNVSPLLIKSALGAVRAVHVVLVLPLLIAVAVYTLWLRRGLRQERLGGALRVAMMLASVAFYAAVRFGLLYVGDGHELLGHSGSPLERLRTYGHLMGSQNRYFLKFGFVAYTGHAAVLAATTHHTLTEAERAAVDDFLAGQPAYTDNALSAPGKKNLVLLVVESLNAWVVGLEVDGRPVTPVLNALCADTTALVSLQMKTQVKAGHSSDGHFMYNTGLLPLTSESVAMNYGDGPFPSLAQALRGYDAFEAVCDQLSMWNQLVTYRTYGYDRAYCFPDLKPRLEADDYVLDRVLLHAAPEWMAQARKPFVAQLVTLNMHSPYDALHDVPPGAFSQGNAYTQPVRNYLEATACFDAALGDFLARLKADGLYDSTVIVIASDHTERVDDDPRGRPALSAEGDDCVFVALNTGRGGRIDGVMGQIDVYPTLLDIMGANVYPWKGLGRSVLRNHPQAAAVTPEVVKGTVAPDQAERMRQAWNVSRLIITGHYFKQGKP